MLNITRIRHKIEIQQLRLFGHLIRMGKSSLVKSITGAISRSGVPRATWSTSVVFTMYTAVKNCKIWDLSGIRIFIRLYILIILYKGILALGEENDNRFLTKLVSRFFCKTSILSLCLFYMMVYYRRRGLCHTDD